MKWIAKKQTLKLIMISIIMICTFFTWCFSLADTKHAKDPDLRIAAFLIAKKVFISTGRYPMIVNLRSEVIQYVKNYDHYHEIQDILRESSIRARADDIYREKLHHQETMMRRGMLPYFQDSPSAAREKYLNEQLGNLAGNSTAKLSAQQVAHLMIGFYAKQLNQLRKDLRTEKNYRGYKYLIDSHFNEIWIESHTLPILLLMGVDLLRPEAMVSFTAGEREWGKKVSPKLFFLANKIKKKDPEMARSLYRVVTWFTPESDSFHQKSLSEFKHIDEAEAKAFRIVAIVKSKMEYADKARTEKDYILEKWWLENLLSEVPNHFETEQRLKQCEQDISNTSAEEWIQLTNKYYKIGRYHEAARRLRYALAMQGDHQPMALTLKKKLIKSLGYIPPSLGDITSTEGTVNNNTSKPLKETLPVLDDTTSGDKPSNINTGKPLKKNPKVSIKKSIWPFSSGQTWQGSYECGFGNAAMKLVIKKASSKNNTIDGIFDFDFLNTDAKGKLFIHGRYDVQKKAFVFTPGEFISQIGKNPKYGFVGNIEYGEKFTGKMSYRYCRF